jgi:hypothetical protein
MRMNGMKIKGMLFAFAWLCSIDSTESSQRRHRWTGFMVLQKDGGHKLCELDDHGRLVVRPPRNKRRFCQYSDESATPYQLMTARLLVPPWLMIARLMVPPPEPEPSLDPGESSYNSKDTAGAPAVGNFPSIADPPQESPIAESQFPRLDLDERR